MPPGGNCQLQKLTKTHSRSHSTIAEDLCKCGRWAEVGVGGGTSAQAASGDSLLSYISQGCLKPSGVLTLWSGCLAWLDKAKADKADQLLPTFGGQTYVACREEGAGKVLSSKRAHNHNLWHSNRNRVVCVCLQETHRFACPSIRLSVCLTVWLSVCLSVRLFVCFAVCQRV